LEEEKGYQAPRIKNKKWKGFIYQSGGKKERIATKSITFRDWGGLPIRASRNGKGSRGEVMEEGKGFLFVEFIPGEAA